MGMGQNQVPQNYGWLILNQTFTSVVPHRSSILTHIQIATFDDTERLAARDFSQFTAPMGGAVAPGTTGGGGSTFGYDR